MVYILANSANGMNTAWTVARIIEEEGERKSGSMHLAVKREMRRMESDGVIGILPPETQWDSYTLCLRPNATAQTPPDSGTKDHE